MAVTERPGPVPINSRLEPYIEMGGNKLSVGPWKIKPCNTLTALLWAFGRCRALCMPVADTEYYFWRVADILWNYEDDPAQHKFVRNPWSEKMVREAIGERYLAVGGAASSTKCLAPDTLVRRADGAVVAAKDIAVGDKLVGDDGTDRTVTGTRTGRSNMVRIVPTWGDSWECNDDHILTLRRTWAGRKSQARVGDIVDISVKDYLKTSKQFKRQHRLFKQMVQLPGQDTPLPPRLYGLWLADGDIDQPIITIPDFETGTLGYIRSVWGDISEYRYGGTDAPKYRFCKHPDFVALVKSSTVTGIKRLDPRYTLNDEHTRLELLAGFLDGDGHAVPEVEGKVHQHGFTFSQKNRELVEDIKNLADSLGFATSVIRCRKVTCPTRNGRFHGVAYCLRISGDLSRIPTLRKRSSVKERCKGGEVAFTVQPLGEGEWAGFSVDGNHRFLLADGTVTHNSHTFAGWGIVNWLCNPAKTQVAITSISLKEAKKRIWGSVLDLLQKAEETIDLPGAIRDSIGNVAYVSPEGKLNAKFGMSLISADKSRTREAVGDLVGLKAEHFILIADELAELSPSITQTAVANLTKNINFQMVALSNPNSRFDAFGEFATPEDGWDGVNVLSDTEWVTKQGGKYIRLDGERSPNILAGKDIYPFMYRNENLSEDRKMGENSRRYMRMVRAVFFDSEETEGIYNESELTAAGCMKPVEWREAPTTIAGLDLGFTSGGDRSILYTAKVGYAGNGHYVMEFGEAIPLVDDVTNKSIPRTYQIARRLVEECKKRGIKPDGLAVDATGAGSPVCDVIAGEWGTDAFLRINFAGSATDRRVSAKSPDVGHELYVNRMSEIWFVTKEFIRTRQIFGVTTELAREMVARNYENVKSGTLRIRVEPKKEFKARFGRSPDLADAAFVAVDLARQRFGLVAVDPPTGGDDIQRLRLRTNRTFKALGQALFNPEAVLA